MNTYARLRRPTPTAVFDTYWRFAAERQAVFFRRLEGKPRPWTADPIIQEYRFTNAYRAADRVSQYLIGRVQYGVERSFSDTFFRTILFKLFNRIETWELLESTVGEISYDSFDFSAYDACLESAIASGRRIYSAAYIMPTGGRGSGGRKHHMHLSLLRDMMKSSIPQRILDCSTLEDVYKVLLSCDTIGPFLAYQYAIDLNYAPHLEFDEMEFVQPGPGARDGIRKCFSDLGDYDEAGVIRLMADFQSEQFDRLELDFLTLGGRALQLIDCQNLFCEVGKYARVFHPEASGTSGRTRIKQKFKMDSTRVAQFYPPKWGIGDLCLQPAAS